MFKVLGDETRCKIFSLLLADERNVGQISDNLGVSQSLVSHHLHDLRMVGLVKYRRDGVRVYYSVNKDSVKKLIKSLREGIGDI